MGRCRRLWLAPMHANWSICWGGPAWIFGNALLENCNSLMAAACWMPIFTTGTGKKSLWSPTLIRGFQAGRTPTRRAVSNRSYPTEEIFRLLAALEPILPHREQLHSHTLPGATAEQNRPCYRCYRRQLQHCVPFDPGQYA